MDGLRGNIFPLANSKKYLFRIVIRQKFFTNSEFGIFLECDSEYPAEIEQIHETFLLCPYQVEDNCELFSDYMDFNQQPIYKPT